MSFYKQSHNKDRNLNHGYLLVETMVFVAIVSMTLALFVTIFLSFNSSSLRVKTKLVLDNSANTIMERIIREIRVSDSVDENLSVLNVDEGVLVLNQTDSQGGPTVLSFLADGATVYLDRDRVDLGELLPPDVSLTSLVFRLLKGDRSSLVRVEMVLDKQGGQFQASQNYYNSAILRNSY